MTKLILTMSMSLDGFVGGPKGELEWIFDGDPEAIAWKLEMIWSAGIHIMGSRTFQSMAAYWPTSTSAFAPPMNQIPKAVFSSQGLAVLKAARTTAFNDTQNGPDGMQVSQHQPGAESWGSAYLAGGALANEIAKLKTRSGKPIIAHGGAAFARSLIAQNLIDEYALVVHPIVLGTGLSIFSDVEPPKKLNLVSSTVFPKGSVAHIYRPV